MRNSTHTLVKILQPFDGPALRLVSYTHPEYLAMLTEYFRSAAPAERGDAFLMRGTEGETVANANRAQQIDWFHAGQQTLLVERDAPTDELAPAPEGRDAAATADWIAARPARRAAGAAADRRPGGALPAGGARFAGRLNVSSFLRVAIAGRLPPGIAWALAQAQNDTDRKAIRFPC